MFKSITVNENVPAAFNYPCILRHRHDDIFVMFDKPGHGMVIASETPDIKAGYFCEQWSMAGFENFSGSIDIFL